MKILRIYFLGSEHKAKNYTTEGNGTPYNKDKNVYFRKWTNGEDEKMRFVFSGPSGLDIFRSANSISKKALKILPKYIKETNLDKEGDLKIEIAGHSRGGLIAQKVYEGLKGKYTNAKFSIRKYDEYAGPFNRLPKKNDVHDLSEIDSSIVVISLNPTVPFNSIAKNNNAKIIIFTTCSHGSSWAVGKAFERHYKDKKSGVFYHISDFYFNKGTETIKAQIKKLDKKDYHEISSSNVLNESRILAKELKCKIEDSEEDLNKIVDTICKKVSDRRGEIFKEILKKFNLLPKSR